MGRSYLGEAPQGLPPPEVALRHGLRTRFRFGLEGGPNDTGVTSRFWKKCVSRSFGCFDSSVRSSSCKPSRRSIHPANFPKANDHSFARINKEPWLCRFS